MIQAIFSIRPQFVKLILSGEKTVEIRSRKVRLNQGTNVWVYATAPISGIVAIAEVESVTYNDPSEIWEKFKDEMCVDKEFFDSYTANSQSVSALKLISVRECNDLLTLESIRESVKNFRPPQFYLTLSPDCKLFRILNHGSIT